MNHRILLPTNGSLPALVATKTAVALAKERGATLILLHVIEQDTNLYIEQLSEDLSRLATEVDGIAFAQRLAKEAGLRTETMEREGAVTGEILKAADESEASMIVMGSSNPRGLRGLYLGDVAEAVTKHAKVSVFIVRPTEDEMEGVMKMVRPHAPAVEEDRLSAIVRSRKFKVGLVLFSIYVTLYTIFTLLGTYGRDIMTDRLLGTNLGIVMGMSVIALAIIMAVTFNFYAVRVEKEGD